MVDQLFSKSIYDDIADFICQCILRNRCLKNKRCARMNLSSGACNHIVSHLFLLLERWMVHFDIGEKMDFVCSNNYKELEV